MLRLKSRVKFLCKVALNIILLIIVIRIGVCIYVSIRTDNIILKDKETLIASIKKDKGELEELVMYLYGLDYRVITKKTIKGVNTISFGYKTYNNKLLGYIFERYKLDDISSVWKKRKIVDFNISKSKEGSDYWGFYYSYDGEPRGEFEDARDPLVKDGAGYRTTANYTYYTEHITGNWYYYETYWYHGLWK